MEILVYRPGTPKIIEGSTEKDLPELLKDKSAVIWVDMEQPNAADERVLLDIFHFHPLTVEDCRENRHYPKIEEFHDYIYFIVHGVTADTSASDHAQAVGRFEQIRSDFRLTADDESFTISQCCL